MTNKFIVLLGDGMSDWPLESLENKTPIEAAKTPGMDFIAKNGVSGLVKTVPDGFKPGSDIANMSILGYDPAIYYSGRGPIEASCFGITAPKDKIIFRCNFVTIINNIMSDFTGGHIHTENSDKIIKKLNEYWKNGPITFFTGVSYRNLAMVDRKYLGLSCTPPHDITDQVIDNYLPQGKFASELKAIMQETQKVINNLDLKGNKVNNIWLWGQGENPKFELFQKKYRLTGGIVTAVGLLKGIGKLIGFETPNVPGATGFIDTNYQGKLNAAFDILKRRDFVFLHIEAPDEAGHMGDIKLKIKAIEDFDAKIVTPMLAYQEKHPDTTIMVLPDHPTPCKIKTHSADPVPFAIYHKNILNNGAAQYSEKEADSTNLFYDNAENLLKYLITR
ncbi:cofactor-independent phosphoglycerate mutase [Candidatus Margulisiibacteriota bacterium]